jgi:hypothetical protein
MRWFGSFLAFPKKGRTCNRLSYLCNAKCERACRFMSSESAEAISPTVLYNLQILSAKSNRLPVADKII